MVELSMRVPPPVRGDARRRRTDRRARRHDHAGACRSPFSSDLFRCGRTATWTSSIPVEYVTLLAAANARLVLECGYTAARSGGSLHNIDVWLKKAIEEDLMPGPRLAASGREICGAGA